MIGVPKPPPREPKPPKRLKRSWLKRGTKPLPKVNRVRQERRKKAYGAHIRSAYWQDIRRRAYERDGGRCQCPICREVRGEIKGRMEFVTPDQIEEAVLPIAVWFDTRGGFHGFDTHHTTYARFGHELLSDVLTIIPAHHRKLEALTGKRRHFLAGSR